VPCEQKALQPVGSMAQQVNKLFHS